MLEMLGHGHVYAITRLEVDNYSYSREIMLLAVQEPSSQVIPGLRYKAKCKYGQ